MLEKRNEVDNLKQIIDDFDLAGVQTRNIEDLSGGELQRFACAVTCVRKSDM
jgi:ATP-binding cassette subfamily E protein 1